MLSHALSIKATHTWHICVDLMIYKPKAGEPNVIKFDLRPFSLQYRQYFCSKLPTDACGCCDNPCWKGRWEKVFDAKPWSSESGLVSLQLLRSAICLFWIFDVGSSYIAIEFGRWDADLGSLVGIIRFVYEMVGIETFVSQRCHMIVSVERSSSAMNSTQGTCKYSSRKSYSLRTGLSDTVIQRKSSLRVSNFSALWTASRNMSPNGKSLGSFVKGHSRGGIRKHSWATNVSSWILRSSSYLVLSALCNSKVKIFWGREGPADSGNMPRSWHQSILVHFL